MTRSSITQPATPTPSLRGSFVKSTIWVLGTRWATRGLGLFSTVILARVLTPQDFGLVAMATVVSGFLGTLFTNGISTALIQNANTSREHWDTAWSIGIIQSTILAGLLILLAPLTAHFYTEPRVSMIMLVLAVGVFVTGFSNIGVVAFQKDLRFDRDFQFTISQKILQICVTIPLALLFQNYWALLAGILASQVFLTVISYVLHPFRPRWSLSRATEIFGFSSRMALISLASYIIYEGERLIIGSLTGARQTGIYAISSEVANIPTAELSGSVSRAIVPGLVKLRSDPDRLQLAYLNVFGFVALFALPAGFGTAVVAPDLVEVVLGSKWGDAIPLIQLLALAGMLRALASTVYNLLIVLGWLNTATVLSWLQAGSLIVLLVPTISYFGLVGAAILNVALAALTLILYINQLARCTNISFVKHLSVLGRPIVSTGAMVAACEMIASTFVGPVALISTVLCGVVVYLSMSLALWSFCGRPPGPEKHLLELIGLRVGLT